MKSITIHGFCCDLDTGTVARAGQTYQDLMSALAGEGYDGDRFCAFASPEQLAMLRVEWARVHDAIACEQRIAHPQVRRATAQEAGERLEGRPYEVRELIDAIPVLRGQLAVLREMTAKDIGAGA